VAVTVVLSWLAHKRAGWTLPVPWPDESAFLWQSISVMEKGSLFSPVLNSNQPVMWMPPGYMIATGVLFKLFGFSLANARWISWVLSIAAYLGIVTLFRETRRAITMITATSALFFLGSFFVVMGNVARMESMLMAMAVWSFVLLARGMVWYALSILIVAGLVHPNAMYFLVAGLAWSVFIYRKSWPAPRRRERAAFVFALLLVAAYGVYVSAHWPTFHAQMDFQMARKRMLVHDTPRFLLNFKKLSFVAVFLCSMAGALRVDRRMLLPLLLGFASFATFILTREMWYDVYFVLSIILLAGSLMVMVEGFMRAHHRAHGWAAALGVSVLFVTFGLHESFVESPFGYPSRMRWHEMRMEDGGVPYLKQADISSVRSVLDSLATDPDLKRVQYHPFADALLFRPHMGQRWLPVQPVFTESTADVMVVHLSRYFPASWDGLTRRNLEQIDSVVWRSERDSTESWLIGIARERNVPR